MGRICSIYLLVWLGLGCFSALTRAILVVWHGDSGRKYESSHLGDVYKKRSDSLGISLSGIASKATSQGTSCTSRQSEYSIVLDQGTQIHTAYLSFWNHRLAAGLVEDASRQVRWGYREQTANPEVASPFMPPQTAAPSRESPFLKSATTRMTCILVGLASVFRLPWQIYIHLTCTSFSVCHDGEYGVCDERSCTFPTGHQHTRECHSRRLFSRWSSSFHTYARYKWLTQGVKISSVNCRLRRNRLHSVIRISSFRPLIPLDAQLLLLAVWDPPGLPPKHTCFVQIKTLIRTNGERNCTRSGYRSNIVVVVDIQS